MKLRHFKYTYIGKVLWKCVAEMGTKSELGIPDFWSKFNIAYAINYIKGAWNKVLQSKLHTGWRKLWPSVADIFTGFPSVESQVQEIVQVTRKLPVEDFEDMKMII